MQEPSIFMNDPDEKRASAAALATQHERQRIAHLLHDDVQQLLYAALATAGMLRANLAGRQDAASQADWVRLEGLLETAVETIRTLSVRLNPLSNHRDSLGNTLYLLTQHMKKLHQLDVELQIKAAPSQLSEEQTTLILQMIREMLFNVVKHAQVNKALVIVTEQHGHVDIKVIDHGVGFPPDNLPHKHGFGLAHVHEQVALLGGTLTIISAPEQGCSIQMILPKKMATCSG